MCVCVCLALSSRSGHDDDDDDDEGNATDDEAIAQSALSSRKDETRPARE